MPDVSLCKIVCGRQDVGRVCLALTAKCIEATFICGVFLSGGKRDALDKLGSLPRIKVRFGGGVVTRSTTTRVASSDPFRSRVIPLGRGVFRPEYMCRIEPNLVVCHNTSDANCAIGVRGVAGMAASASSTACCSCCLELSP
jgi:hypothetical protein